MGRYRRLLYFLLGLGMTSPLLALVVGGYIISLTTVTIALVFFDLLLRKHRRQFSVRNQNSMYKYFMAWMLISIASSIFGFGYFLLLEKNKDFAFSSISFIPKILFYLFLFYLFSTNRMGEYKMLSIIRGLKFGILLNLVWAVVDAGMFYTTGESLTNNIFASYIAAADMPNGLASTVDGLSIRSVGLTNDEANIGFFSTIAVIYSFLYRKIWLTVLGILATLSSVTFIGIVGIICAFIWQMIFRKESKHRLRNAMAILVTCIAALIFFNTSNNDIIVGLRTAVEIRAEAKQEGDHSGEARKLFITKFPAALTHLPTSLLIGTGYTSAIYAYYPEGLVYDYAGYGKNNPKPAAMENTFVEYFFDLGLWGTLFFILLYFRILTISYQKYCITGGDFYAFLFAYAFGDIFEFAFYHSILYSMDMIACIAAVLYLEKKNAMQPALIVNQK